MAFKQEKPIVLAREKTFYESMKEYMYTKAHIMFMEQIPSEDIKAMSPEYSYPIGGVVLVSVIAIFIYVFLNGYLASVNTTFLSPSTGTEPSRDCVLIPTVITGTFLATIDGKWQGKTGFQYAKAAYELSVTSMSLSYKEYDLLMNAVFDSLQQVKQLAVNFDLAYNLVYWMSGVFIPYSNNLVQRFYFVGTPLEILNRNKITGTLSNVYGNCKATSKAKFDSSTGILSLSYLYSEYITIPECTNITQPEALGYIGSADVNDFSISLDVRSLITCVAVNLGVLGVEYLVEIPSYDKEFTFEGQTYIATSFYDPKYKGMAPISCIALENRTNCVIVLENQVYGVPVFNHVGTSASMPIPCNCSTLNAEQLSDRYFACNLFAFLAGVLYYPTTTPYDIMRLWTYNGAIGYYGLFVSPVNIDSYYPMYYDSFFGLNSVNATQFQKPSVRQAAYDFCNVPGTNNTCSFLTFTLFDNYPTSWAVSDNYYQVATGACNNSFVQTYAEW
jgi:hypothetical protein